MRGLAVDAALFGAAPRLTGQVPSDRAQSDVDALGSLVYLLATGRWPGPLPPAPSAPRAGGMVLPPSQVTGRPAPGHRRHRRAIRERGCATARSGAGRGSTGFAIMVGAVLDHVAPISTTVRAVPPSAGRRTAQQILRVVLRPWWSCVAWRSRQASRGWAGSSSPVPRPRLPSRPPIDRPDTDRAGTRRGRPGGARRCAGHTPSARTAPTTRSATTTGTASPTSGRGARARSSPPP